MGNYLLLILFKDLFVLFLSYMSFHACVYAHECRCLESLAKGNICFGASVTSELFDMGVGNQVQVL